MTAAQLTTGLPAAEIAPAELQWRRSCSTKTPLWYYVLREAMVLQNGDQLGPLGGRIVAETFVRMLKRDGDSFMNVLGLRAVAAELRAGNVHDRGPAGVCGSAGAVGS